MIRNFFHLSKCINLSQISTIVTFTAHFTQAGIHKRCPCSRELVRGALNKAKSIIMLIVVVLITIFSIAFIVLIMKLAYSEGFSRSQFVDQSEVELI